MFWGLFKNMKKKSIKKLIERRTDVSADTPVYRGSDGSYIVGTPDSRHLDPNVRYWKEGVAGDWASDDF